MTQLKPPVDSHHHVVPIWIYVRTMIVLLILMGITVGVSFIQLPSVGPISGTLLNQGFALMIAVIKASLVVGTFMGVAAATQLTKFWAFLGFTWLTFFTVMAGDYAMRKYEIVEGWEKAPASALPRSVGSTDHIDMGPTQNEINVRPRQ